jgi:uncharacterized protein YegP (UPF0339 family)
MSLLEFYTDAAGEHRWRLKGENGEIVGASSEGFSSPGEARRNAFRVLDGLTSELVRAGSLPEPPPLAKG